MFTDKYNNNLLEIFDKTRDTLLYEQTHDSPRKVQLALCQRLQNQFFICGLAGKVISITNPAHSVLNVSGRLSDFY